jgi:mannose-6-phosphate isomerase-like protein (cupin superfamily)
MEVNEMMHRENERKTIKSSNPVVAVSGGYDPLHGGHIALFKEAATYGDLTVILNTDEWLIRKKGFFFQCLEDRAEIIGILPMVKNVVTAKDEDNTVVETLKELKPDYFCNGGDRILKNTPENKICEEIGIKSLYEIGGKSKYSNSSHIVAKHRVVRKWGYYYTLDFSDNYVAKKIILLPKESISLQRHSRRTETWFVISGNAGAIVGSEFKLVSKGDIIQIQQNELHKIINLDEKEDLIIFEIQSGTFISENDIHRYDIKP